MELPQPGALLSEVHRWIVSTADVSGGAHRDRSRSGPRRAGARARAARDGARADGSDSRPAARRGRPAPPPACRRARSGAPRRTRGSGRRPTRARPGRASRSTIVLPARPSSTDQLEQPLLRARIERRGRLVEQQHLGVGDEHRGDRDALLLAAGELVRRPVGEAGDLEHRQHVGDPLLAPRRARCRAAAARTRPPRAPTARTPARRCSGRRSRRGCGTRSRTARPRGGPR